MVAMGRVKSPESPVVMEYSGEKVSPGTSLGRRRRGGETERVLGFKIEEGRSL